MAYSYERLGPSDVPSFKELLAVFGEAFGDPHTYGDAVPSVAYLAEFLGRSDVIALVGRSEGAVVGGLVAYVLQKFERERSEVYIYDLAVSEAHRRRRVATELIRFLVRIAKTKGAYVVFVQADVGDNPAIRLYESLGKREDVLHFDIPVE